MTVSNVWVGAPGADATRVVAKVTGASVRIAVDVDPTLAAPTFHGPVTPTAEGVASVDIAGLTADTRYWFAVEEDSILDTAFPGRFRTLPAVGSEASFTVGVSSCSGASGPVDVVDDGTVLDPLNVSNHPVFDTIRSKALAESWPMFCHLGDLFYYNLGTDHPATLANYRQALDDVLLQPRVHQLFREVPTAWAWDDHDFGPNNSDSTAEGRPLAQQVYRERVPSYPVPVFSEVENSPIYQSWQIGRVQFILSDTRSVRSPNSTPDGPSKTMLGGVQKDWMRGVLESSTAEFFVWLTPTPWITTGTDNWGGFATEANELVDMFTDLGWLDRMIAVTGDTHYLAIDTGTSGVTYGGIPLFVFGGLDSGTGSSSLGWDTGSVSGGKGRWGTLTVADNGDQIHVTGTGWIDDSVWRSHTVTVTLAVDPGDPGPGPEPVPDVTEGVSRTQVTWLACDLVSGRIIAELPEIRGQVSRVLGAYTSTSLTLPIPKSGPGALKRETWEQATAPGVTMIVPVVNDVPSAGFIVLTRKGGTDATLTFGVVSLEGYLDRRFVGDLELPNRDEAAIAAALVGEAQEEGINLVIDAPNTGTIRTRSYVHTDDATVYSRLRELMAVQNGPEWTIDVDWADTDRQVIRKIFRVRKRIGTAASQPNAVFQTTAPSVYSSRGASEATYEYTEDYSDGRGANHVIATSSGQGDDRPESAPQSDIRQGWPRYERRISPSTSISSQSVLDAHAADEIALRVAGSNTFEIQTRWDSYPQLNVHWRLGDDVAWELTGHRHPDGVLGQGRAIAWELDMQAGVVKPILLDAAEEVAA